MSRRIKYNSSWETEFEWLKPSKMSEYYALCMLCKQYFEIDGSGKSQVIGHSNIRKHVQIEKNRKKVNSETKVITNKSRTSISSANLTKLSKEEELINAEIAWTLRVLDHGGYFDCSGIFQIMFPDSVIAKNVDVSGARIKHLAQFAIAPHIEKMLKLDLQGSPFTFTLVEKIALVQKKELDVYIRYWSSIKDKLTSSIFCGTIYVRNNCNAANVKTNFFGFVKKLNLDCSLLMEINLFSDQNTNSKFHKQLTKELEELYLTSILDLSNSYNLFSVYDGFQKGLSYIRFPYQEFLNDLVYYFKMVRTKNDKNLEAVLEILCKFLFTHNSSRWLSLEPALSKIVEQYKNIKDYFLGYLPKQENYKREIENANKYKYLTKILKDRKTMIYINFIINVTGIFKPLFVNCIKSDQIVHLLHDNFTKLLHELMSNFLRRNLIIKYGKEVEGEQLIQIDCRNKKLHLRQVIIDAATKKEIDQSSLNTKMVTEIYGEFLAFYVESASFLQKRVPLNSEFLKDIKHLHPLKKDYNAIMRISKTIIDVVKNENALNRLFCTQSKSKCSIQDIISNQIKMYILEKDLNIENFEEHWKHIGQLKNNLGEKKYLQLYNLIKCIMVLNLGTFKLDYLQDKIVPEINVNISLDEDSIYAIKIIKSYLYHIGGIQNFLVSTELIKAAKNLDKKHLEHLEKKYRNRKG